MAITPNEFRDIAQGLQSIALALGVLIGGCWTLYTFRNLGMAQKARAELLAIERSQEPGFQLTIKTEIAPPLEVVPPPQNPGYTLLIQLELKNPSRRTVMLDMSLPSITVAHLDVEGKAKPAIDGKPIHIDSTTIAGRSLRKQGTRYLRAGDVRNTVYICKVSEPGLYLVQAQVLYGSASLKLHGSELPDDQAVLAVEQAIVNVV